MTSSRRTALLRPLDVLILALVIAAGTWTLPWLWTERTRVAIVRLDGRKVMRLDLKGASRQSVIEGKIGPVDLEWGERGVRIVHAPCPNPICVRTGFIVRKGSRIVCVPSRVEIEVVSGTGEGSSLDGLTF